ncbi:MAG TPA: hypothetical protein DCS21_04410 [Gammaproteobacteria bacterium]|nr:hypothetical protein [Gammaproteobacteria bacterium]
MSLPYDVTRCHGERGIWEMCPKRDQCRRYLDWGQPGERQSYVMALCQDDQFDSWIPVEREMGK